MFGFVGKNISEKKGKGFLENNGSAKYRSLVGMDVRLVKLSKTSNDFHAIVVNITIYDT